MIKGKSTVPGMKLITEHIYTGTLHSSDGRVSGCLWTETFITGVFYIKIRLS